jgi:hypothetical protein
MRQRVERFALETGLSLYVRNLFYNDSEAREFRESIGKEVGTAETHCSNDRPRLKERPANINPDRINDMDNGLAY